MLDLTFRAILSCSRRKDSALVQLLLAIASTGVNSLIYGPSSIRCLQECIFKRLFSLGSTGGGVERSQATSNVALKGTRENPKLLNDKFAENPEAEPNSQPVFSWIANQWKNRENQESPRIQQVGHSHLLLTDLALVVFDILPDSTFFASYC